MKVNYGNESPRWVAGSKGTSQAWWCGEGSQLHTAATRSETSPDKKDRQGLERDGGYVLSHDYRTEVIPGSW